MKDINHDHAQATLNAELFPHYLLGRQLAMELVLKAFVRALPAKKVAEIAALVQLEADIAVRRLQDEDFVEGTKEQVCECGKVCALWEMGF